MKTKLYQTAILLFILLNINAQENPFKLGKLEASAFPSDICPIDSSANAYIIGEYGRSWFEYNDQKGFQTIFEKHIRVKISKKAAFDWANFEIPLYYSPGAEEKVGEIKGYTYNLENGKVITSKMEKSAIFKEEVNEHNRNMKFTLPNVKEGSVIEVYYKIYSDFYSLKDWNFQHTVPTMTSCYRLEIPEYFNYKVFQNGYESIQNTNSSKSSSLNISYKERSESNRVTSTQFYSEKVDFQLNISSYYANNVKSFRDEPFMKSRKNYLSSLEVELQYTKFPNSTINDFSSNWTQITKKLMDHDNFGDLLLRQGGSGSVIDEVAEKETDPLRKANLLYEYVRDNIKWDGTNRLYASKSIRKILDEKSGNSADLNLLLIRLLRKAGLNADPVVLSTRDNGMIVTEYPVLQKLNHVVARLNINNKTYLLDATDKFCPMGMLPEKCLNGMGRVLSEKSPENVDLVSNLRYSENIVANLSINETGELKGSWDELRRGYAANYYRKKIEAAKGIEGFIENLQKNYTGLAIENHTVENIDSAHRELKMKYGITASNQVETAGNLLMVHPLLFEQLQQNPFKSEDRKFPVDFSFGYNKTYIATITIPTGYQIETLPKSASVSLPDNKASFIYKIENINNTLQVVRRFAINSNSFLPDEYKNLKEFYNIMVNKEAEVIVLKKTI